MAFADRTTVTRRKLDMLRNLFRCALFILLARLSVATPVAAQVIEPNAQPFSFPVLGGASFTVDAQGEATNKLFHLGDRALLLRSTAGGLLDMDAYCELPDRHWGPVTLVGS